MNFLQISLTSKCNLKCKTCPMAVWRNTDNEPFVLTNERLFPWLKKWIHPNEWLIELTGGEPALYKGINKLCAWLFENGYNTLIKTNGLLEIKPVPHVRRIAAFHQLDNPPRYFDEILIVDKLEREAKEVYCKEHGLTYRVIGFNKENPDGATHGFDKILYVDPHGHAIGCPACTVRWEEGFDPYTIEHKMPVPVSCCKECKAAVDAWRFYDVV